MPKLLLKDRCSVNTNIDTDVFVGLQCSEGIIKVSFPLGFHISDDEKELRKDILLLTSTLVKNTDRRDSTVLGQALIYDKVDFPIQAYLFIIRDFYERGYYKEREVYYNISKRGKINWSRTIKTQKEYAEEEDIFYLNFVTKKSMVKENELITLIHEYCVYESFEKMGWLFSEFMPMKPQIKFIKKMFICVVKDKLSNTFNDKNRRLFQNMLAIIEYLGDEEVDKNFLYGTYRFEYVWEKMINRVFGVDNKTNYFPKTTWNLVGKDFCNASLKPDTIMLCNNKIYVLDAKYYKFGWTKLAEDLPESTSINKQITYGEYIAENEVFRRANGSHPVVYNAFLMPYDANGERFNTGEDMYFVGTARSNWKGNTKEYEKVQGILLDVKYLMSIAVRRNEDEIIRLAELIDSVV